MNIEYWSLEKIIPYARNPRNNKAAVASVKSSIKEYGWRQPIVVDSEGIIIAGHTRFLAAQELGLLTVPVHVATELTPAQVKAYRLADNRTAQNAEWDEELLAMELAELKEDDFDLSLTAFTDKELRELLAADEDEFTDTNPRIAEANALKDKYGVELGQLWELGPHRIICGDSGDPDTVQRLMGDDRADLFQTDPPYAVKYTGDDHPKDGIDWSELYQDCDLSLYDRFIRCAIQYAIKDNAAWYCWHAGTIATKILSIWDSFGAFLHQTIIWKKNRSTLGFGTYMFNHEPCLHGWIKGNKPYMNKDREQYSTVWEFNLIVDSRDARKLHPTMKPLELFEIPINTHTKPGDICYEPFSGSGTQIMACEKLGRICRAVEIQPAFVAVALQRYFDSTGIEPKQVT